MTDYNQVLCQWIIVSLQSFIGDGPGNEYQRGYLSAVLDMGCEVDLKSHPIWIEANKVLQIGPRIKP